MLQHVYDVDVGDPVSSNNRDKVGDKVGDKVAAKWGVFVSRCLSRTPKQGLQELDCKPNLLTLQSMIRCKGGALVSTSPARMEGDHVHASWSVDMGGRVQE